jgi:peptidoglycan/xylan/chitin deacetylase (PgdA/CDA1 family)
MNFSFTSQIRHELWSLLHGYPSFVLRGDTVPTDHVPVFVYHTIDPASFEKDLCFLAENGYQPIGMGALTEYLNGGGAVPDRSVVLTFDDARSSFWRYAYPLLQRYEMKGVLFVIAGLTTDAPTHRENLFSVWDGQRTLADLQRLDPDDSTLCTWPELRVMHDSGWVEIESHSLFHQEVFVGTEIQDIIEPNSSFAPFQTAVTAYLTPQDIGQPITPSDYYGLPVFPSASLHEGVRAWDVPEDVRRHARAVWQAEAADGAHDRPRKRVVQAHWERGNVQQDLRRQTEADVRHRIRDDLVQARALIKEEVSPDAGDHFCLPYGAGSSVSLQIQRELGIESCSWGVIPDRKKNVSGDDPMRICRIKADFIWRLPGRGRKSLWKVYQDKVMRRVRGERVY